jgi:hypothetical protein
MFAVGLDHRLSALLDFLYDCIVNLNLANCNIIYAYLLQYPTPFTRLMPHHLLCKATGDLNLITCMASADCTGQQHPVGKLSLQQF